jgi:membrane protein
MAKKLSRFHKIRADAQALLDESALPSLTELSNWHKFAHFWVLVVRSFVRNRCPVRASALAYATVLALIPMLAVVVSITSSLLKKEGEESIDRFIVKLVSSVTSATMPDKQGTGTETNQTAEGTSAIGVTNPAIIATNGATETTNALATAADTSATATNVLSTLTRNAEAVKARHAVARYIHQFIQNTRSGALGVTGSALLIFVAISMLSRIEDTFNDIWGVARGRAWFMRVMLYWSVISLVPVLLVVALGLATGPHLEATKKLLTTMPFVGHYVMPFVFQAAPIVVLCLTFGMIYILIPNTKVRWSAALVGGLVGGILFHLNNVVSVLYVSRVVSNSKIYGSLGLVPVFMIGLYLSWLILLFGAQVAYAYQNRATYLEERQVENINQRGREFVALRLMTLVGQRFLAGEPPPSLVEIGSTLAVPTRLVQQVIQTLCAARLIVEAAGGEAAFLPARPLETITCHDVLRAMRATQGQELATRDEPTRGEVYGEFHRIEEAERQAAASVTMLALVNRTQAPQQLPE